MSKYPEYPPKEVWVVSNKEGIDIACESKMMAEDQATIMAGDFPELSPWRVCRYVAEPFAKGE